MTKENQDTGQTPKRVQTNKVQAVLTEALKNQLDSFKAEKGYKNDGEALRAILTAFFNGDTKADGGNTEALEHRIEHIENALWGDDKDIPERANKAYENYAGLDDAYEDVADSQREQSAKIRELEKQLKELKTSMQKGSQAQDNSEDINEISEDTQEPSKETDFPLPLSQAQLGKRLGCSTNAVGQQRRKGEESFKTWTKKRDPDGISWKYGKDRKYRPLS